MYSLFRGLISMARTGTQREQAIDLLRVKGIARLSEFTDAGITAATIGRMVRTGDVNQLARGLYQLPDAPLDANHSLAEATKRVPKGVVCLVSALAYHELTDQLPRAVWMAIGSQGLDAEGGKAGHADRAVYGCASRRQTSSPCTSRMFP